MTATITEPGVYDLPADVYHRDPVPGGSLSQSGAKLLLKAPAKFAYDRAHPSAGTRSMNLGTAAHALVLGAGAPIVTVPEGLLSSDGGVRSNAAKAWKAEAIEAGKTVVTADEAAVIDAMAEKIRSHPTAGPLFARPGRAEVAMFARDADTGVMMRGLADWMPEAGSDRQLIVDYKTTTDASPEEFARSVARYGYHVQGWWYPALVSALMDEPDPAMVFVVQETEAPYLVAVYELDPTAIRIGGLLGRRAMNTYKACMASGHWPGYSTEVASLRLPYYVENQYESELFG